MQNYFKYIIYDTCTSDHLFVLFWEIVNHVVIMLYLFISLLNQFSVKKHDRHLIGNVELVEVSLKTHEFALESFVNSR